MSLQDVNEKVDRMIQDGDGRLNSNEIDQFILEALSYFSKDVPYLKVADISGDGAYQYDLPDDWAEGFSYITAVEYPAGGQVPKHLDPEDYTVYQTPTAMKLHFYELTPAIGETIRITYTTAYPDVANIPAPKQDGFCNLAAGLCCGALARLYAQVSDSAIEADSVNYGNKSNEYAARAKELILRYQNFLGRQDGVPLAAGAVKDWDANYSWGGDFLTHPGKDR